MTVGTTVYSLKPNDETIQAIQSEIDSGRALNTKSVNYQQQFLDWCDSTGKVLSRVFSDQALEREFLIKATNLSKGISYLERLMINVNSGLYLRHAIAITGQQFDFVTFHEIIRRMLHNFYKYIEEMYQKPVHGNGTFQNADLNKVKIGNEYDVQRMLYSIVRTVFPEARVEVPDDGGYRGVRYDIYLDNYDTIIEVKCSRPSMKTRELTEQLGSDAFHYRAKNIYFFIYDKDKVIDNADAFCKSYSKHESDGKQLETVVIQPITL